MSEEMIKKIKDILKYPVKLDFDARQIHQLYPDNNYVQIDPDAELPEKVADEMDDIFDMWALRPNYARQLIKEMGIRYVPEYDKRREK